MAEHHLTCRTCGVQFTYHRRKAYCSKGCYPSAPKGTSKPCKPDKYRRGGVYLKKEDRPEPCEGCGTAAPLYKSFCQSCLAAQKRIRHQAYSRRYRSRECLPPILISPDCLYAKCQECRAGFEYTKTTQFAVQGFERRYCSRLCQKKASDRNRTKARRARVRGTSVELIDVTKVFDRDAWRCGICGRKTRRSKRGSCHPLAPELDHIVALANGGSHTWDNVQCSCRECNGRKGATDYGQIPLFPAA